MKMRGNGVIHCASELRPLRLSLPSRNRPLYSSIFDPSGRDTNITLWSIGSDDSPPSEYGPVPHFVMLPVRAQTLDLIAKLHLHTIDTRGSRMRGKCVIELSHVSIGGSIGSIAVGTRVEP